MSPKQDSAKKKNKYKTMSNQSTPISQRLNFGSVKHKIQTTAMKRRRKRDPTICRKGLEQMNPYIIIKDESELLKTPNQALNQALQQSQYSKLVEKWCRYEYFYSSIDK